MTSRFSWASKIAALTGNSTIEFLNHTTCAEVSRNGQSRRHCCLFSIDAQSSGTLRFDPRSLLSFQYVTSQRVVRPRQCGSSAVTTLLCASLIRMHISECQPLHAGIRSKLREPSSSEPRTRRPLSGGRGGISNSPATRRQRNGSGNERIAASYVVVSKKGRAQSSLWAGHCPSISSRRFASLLPVSK